MSIEKLGNWWVPPKQKLIQEMILSEQFQCFPMLEKAFDLPQNTLKLISMIHFFWRIGTHYYDPLSNAYTSRDEFIKDAQNPMKNLYVVGEMISNNQGWTEGALESVKEIFHSDI